MDTEAFTNTWPYILQGLTRMDSPVHTGISLCNQLIFPPEQIVDRVAGETIFIAILTMQIVRSSQKNFFLSI